MAEYHILFAINKRYVDYIFVTAQSVVAHLEDTGSQDHFVFHSILDESVNETLAKAYAQAVVEFNASLAVSCEFKFYSIQSSLFAQLIVEELDEEQELGSYYNLLVGSLLDPAVYRVLFLDPCVMVCSDIRKMFAQYSAGNELLCASGSPFN